MNISIWSVIFGIAFGGMMVCAGMIYHMARNIKGGVYMSSIDAKDIRMARYVKTSIIPIISSFLTRYLVIDIKDVVKSFIDSLDLEKTKFINSYIDKDGDRTINKGYIVYVEKKRLYVIPVDFITIRKKWYSPEKTTMKADDVLVCTSNGLVSATRYNLLEKTDFIDVHDLDTVFIDMKKEDKHPIIHVEGKHIQTNKGETDAI